MSSRSTSRRRATCHSAIGRAIVILGGLDARRQSFFHSLDDGRFDWCRGRKRLSSRTLLDRMCGGSNELSRRHDDRMDTISILNRLRCRRLVNQIPKSSASACFDSDGASELQDVVSCRDRVSGSRVMRRCRRRDTTNRRNFGSRRGRRR